MDYEKHVQKYIDTHNDQEDLARNQSCFIDDLFEFVQKELGQTYEFNQEEKEEIECLLDDLTEEWQ